MSFYLSSTDMIILLELTRNDMTIGSLTKMAGLYPAKISGSVSHLSGIDLISVNRKGRSKLLHLIKSEVGDRFRSFILQNPNIDPMELFHGNGLMMMRSLIGQGSSIKEITNRSALSRSTVNRYLKKWKRMGVVWKQGHGGRFTINRNYPDLKIFLISFSRHWLLKEIIDELGDPSIIFNDGERVIFTYKGELDRSKYRPAGYTLLAENGFDVVTTTDYYQFRPGSEGPSILEAIIQAMRIDPLNPRPRKILLGYLKSDDLKKAPLMEYGRKYGIEDILNEEVSKIEREEIFQEDRSDRNG